MISRHCSQILEMSLACKCKFPFKKKNNPKNLNYVITNFCMKPNTFMFTASPAGLRFKAGGFNRLYCVQPGIASAALSRAMSLKTNVDDPMLVLGWLGLVMEKAHDRPIGRKTIGCKHVRHHHRIPQFLPA